MSNLKRDCGYLRNGLYIEPNYSMPTEEDGEGNRDGEFNLGIGYRF